MKREHLIAPSVLAADFRNLSKDFEMVNQSEADWFHIDIMDGRFVPNISFGLSLMPAIKDLAQKPLDVHLMIEQPELYVEEFAKQGADILTVHAEACPHLHRNIQQIKSLGVKAGVAINPGTPIQLIEDVLEEVDLICMMSVNPGFGGQKFIYRTLHKITELRKKCDERNLNPFIEVDGGVGLQNAESIVKAGADVLVAGSSVFKSNNPIQTIEQLKNITPFNITL